MSLKKLVYALSVGAVVAAALVSLAGVGQTATAGDSGMLPEVVVTAKAPALPMDTVEVLPVHLSVEPFGVVNYN